MSRLQAGRISSLFDLPAPLTADAAASMESLTVNASRLC
jgi:hypothetical protein